MSNQDLGPVLGAQLQRPPNAVLRAFAVDSLRSDCHRGLSGSAVWRVESSTGSIALRRWNAASRRERIAEILAAQSSGRQAGLNFVPNVVRPMQAPLGYFVESDSGAIWSAESWVEGSPQAVSRWTVDQSVAALESLGKWHRAFPKPSATSPPALERRRQEWQICRTQGLPSANRETELYDLATRTIGQTRRLAPSMSRWLADNQDNPAEPPARQALCLRDCRAEHVLFDAAKVAGVVDYGALGVDVPACDVARYLGDLFADDDAAWAAVEQAATIAGIVSHADFAFARRLDRTGAVLAASRWLRWLIVKPRPDLDRRAAAGRWRRVVERLERMSPTE